MLAVFGPTAIDQIGQGRKNREVEDGIDADSDPQKPPEGPGERGMRLGHDEFRNFEARRKQQDKPDGKRCLVRDRRGQRKKSYH
jgi:hypothetical protein